MNRIYFWGLLAFVLVLFMSPCVKADPAETVHKAAQTGDEASVLNQLRMSPGALHIRDGGGRTPLLTAISAGQVGVVKLLLDHEADANAVDDRGWGSLHHAAYHGGRRTAGRGMRLELIKLLLNAGADPGARDAQGRTVYHVAAVLGHLDLLQHLPVQGPHVRIKDKLGRSPLHLAAQGNHVGVITWLVEQGVSHEADFTGHTPLHLAAERFREAATRALLRHGAKVDAVNNEGRTPLHLLASSGPAVEELDKLRAATAEVLLLHGADVNARDARGHTSLGIAESKHLTDFAQVLRERGGAQ
ncbi:MAG: ankyrin repeat domain-containing protein [Planctomycetota bacterium]|jgi:ankyrin repeat protein